MNEETSERTVRLAVTTTKLTAKVLWSALRKFLLMSADKLSHPKGLQTVKQLIKQGQGASSVDVSGESIGLFKKIANKYGVDFAVVKDKAAEQPRYTVFFKARDVDAIQSVVKAYSSKIVQKKAEKVKPSVIEQLRRLKEMTDKSPKRKVHEKIKENVR